MDMYTCRPIELSIVKKYSLFDTKRNPKRIYRDIISKKYGNMAHFSDAITNVTVQTI